ncbi:hypothetical protein Patl1_03724 [Pistacia atlantica]|uniref:Uncharacterized protein n=1 Tax=Pistacia atlantica TaxID=434234 RepID=A0ACC1BWJ8_9ROSI|nr:hypothetical protein Patl1_03724 [Pistacia atlantica]
MISLILLKGYFSDRFYKKRTLLFSQIPSDKHLCFALYNIFEQVSG